jgi:hypothetical protein
MTNKEKSLLRSLAKRGFDLEKIRNYVNCSDITIKNYIKIFSPKEDGEI